jgi:toxin ParE1/3/4
MPSKPVEFHEAAALDYEAAFDWYLEHSELAAARFSAELDRAVAQIVASPQLGPIGVHGTRKFLLQRFPFAIVYRELPTTVQVLAVAHLRRRPNYWKGRLQP